MSECGYHLLHCLLLLHSSWSKSRSGIGLLFYMTIPDSKNSRSPLTYLKQPKVPGAPPIPDWHVKGEAIGGEACDRLGVGSSTTDTSFEEPRIVTLTGLSGTGKSTLASMVVAREDVRMSFHKGVLWLPVGRGAKDRLPELINRLAGMVYETVMRKASRPPRTKVIEKNPEDGAAYIREVVDESSRRFIVVADDVWEVDVLEELKKAGASVLCTTREDSLLPDGPPLQLDQFPREEAEMVLRRAAELDDNELLPEPASELMRRCESVMLDLLLVGRRGEVRGRSDDHAWQTALRRIMEAQKGGEDGKPLSWRAAALRAGLEALACDNPQNKEHYLALAILSAGLASPSEVGAFLLYGNDCSAEDKKAVEQVLGTLERWSIVTLDVDGEYYRVHDTHVDFIQDCLLDTLDSVLPRWRKYISSVQAVNTYTSDWLSKIWGVLGKIEGGAVIPCSYDKVLDPSNAELPKALKKTAELHYDDQDWSDACDKYSGLADTLHNLGTCVNKMVGREEESESLFRRALEIREQTLGPDHPYVSNTLHSLEVCTREAGETGEADKLLRQALAIRKEKLSSDLLELAQIQYSLGVCVYNTGRLQQAEELLKEALVIREGCLGYDHLDVRSTIYWRMWACINVFWRLYIYVRHSYPRFSHYVGLLGLHYMPLHRSGRTHDKRLPAQASRGKSATWSNSILGVIAAADFVSGVAGEWLV